jgi:ComF family protein
MIKKYMWKTNQIKNFVLDIIFPQFCIQCGKEGGCLCPDCFNLIDILEYQFCPVCGKRLIQQNICDNCVDKTNLNGIFSASSYANFIIKKSVARLKYEPYLKNLSKTFADLIITHFSLLDNNRIRGILQNSILIPVPISKEKIKIRNFNQAQEIAKELSNKLNLPIFCDVLLKIKSTSPQVGLPSWKRKENVKNAFVCANPGKTKNRKILLIDDVFTTGSTMEECAKTLKNAGARQVFAVVVAREF